MQRGVYFFSSSVGRLGRAWDVTGAFPGRKGFVFGSLGSIFGSVVWFRAVRGLCGKVSYVGLE